MLSHRSFSLKVEMSIDRWIACHRIDHCSSNHDLLLLLLFRCKNEPLALLQNPNDNEHYPDDIERGSSVSEEVIEQRTLRALE